MRWCQVSNPDWFYHYISFPDCSLSSHAESPTIHSYCICVHTHPFKIFQSCWVNKAALKCISYLRLIKSLALVQEAVHKMKQPRAFGRWLILLVSFTYSTLALLSCCPHGSEWTSEDQKNWCTTWLEDIKLMHVEYNGKGCYICGVSAWWLMLGYILVTVGLPFWS